MEASTILYERGFEQLRLGERKVFWRQNGNVNVVIESSGDSAGLNFKTGTALISVYRGSTPRENMIHQEIGYEIGDVTAFVDEFDKGLFA